MNRASEHIEIVYLRNEIEKLREQNESLRKGIDEIAKDYLDTIQDVDGSRQEALNRAFKMGERLGKLKERYLTNK